MKMNPTAKLSSWWFCHSQQRKVRAEETVDICHNIKMQLSSGQQIHRCLCVKT